MLYFTFDVAELCGAAGVKPSLLVWLGNVPVIPIGKQNQHRILSVVVCDSHIGPDSVCFTSVSGSPQISHCPYT